MDLYFDFQHVCFRVSYRLSYTPSAIRSIFCLSPAGDTPSSARLFDAIVSGCIPVIVSDELELPFEGILDYRKVCFCLVKLVLFALSGISLVA